MSNLTKENPLKEILQQYEKFDYYLDAKLDRDIEENRKGQFVLNFKDQNGNPLENVSVKLHQISHEFRFGCSLFHLNQFQDQTLDTAYKEKFKNLFNYAVIPFYWDTLEPTEGKPRFSADSEFISRRPPVDSIVEFCEENNIRTKGHCLVYNAFQPDWIPETNREIKIKIDKRISSIAERYGNRIEDFDVINEMLTIYRNCYKGNSVRNLQITDELGHEKWAFDLCRRYFPHSRLFWNEGVEESMGTHYRGHRSFYYMTLEKMLASGVPIEGIGMQYHAYEPKKDFLNPLRIIDVFDCFSRFQLPIHISEVSIPSFSNEPEDEALQAELTRRLFKLWFSRKNCEAIVWWNLADMTAYKDENRYHAGLLRQDCSEKPAYSAIEHLINKEWITDMELTVSGQMRFSGFYGKYEVTYTYNGQTRTTQLNLFKENTGYDNRLCDFRSRDIVLRTE